MTRRPGFTVVEVLVALFILAIGVIAIQTMFPLAAQQLAVAVRTDRSALSAFTADGYIRSYWKSDPTFLLPAEPFFQALDNPDSNTPAPKGLPSAATDTVSYPVVVDPMGWAARPVGTRDWFGDSGVTNLPRRTLNAVMLQPAAAQAQFALRICSLMDGIGYDEFGSPVDPMTGLVNRELRYKWLWIVQRTNNAGNKTTASLTVVTFDDRPPLYAPPGSEAVFGTVLPVTPGDVGLTLTWPAAQQPPDLKAGRWFMDATVGPDPSNPGQWIRNANFYRVTRAVQTSGTTMDVDLETPIRRTDGGGGSYQPTIVVVRGVSGAYTRPILSPGP